MNQIGHHKGKSMETERGVIGIIAEVSQTNVGQALELWETSRLQASDFESQGLGSLWDMVGDFVRAGLPIDIVALTAKAKATHPKGLTHRLLAETLLSPPPSKQILPEYARLIGDSALRRKTGEALRRALENITKPSEKPTDTIQGLTDELQTLSNRLPSLRNSSGDVLTLYSAIQETLKGGRHLCIPTGVEALDEVIGGLQAGVLTMVGAYPGVGKSALLASMLQSIAERNVKVGFFSLEDERLWVTRRMLCYGSGATVFSLTTGKISEADYKALEKEQDFVQATLSNVIIDDRPGLTPTDIIAAARDMVLNHKCQVIMLDHLGEVRLERSERYDLDVADALAGLRDIAKRFKIPVVVASHVRRRMGLTIEDAPALTDFANSSAPERMARVALGLSKVPGGMRCTILKQTNGPSGAEIGLRLLEHAAMVQLDGRLELPEKTK
jgi:replicative DNA helicase